MLNHSTCNRFFFVQQPRRSARRSPGSASGFGRVAQVRAEVRVTHKQFSQRILRISSSSVPSECLASQFPASVAGRSSQRPRVSCACSASRFDLIELPSLSEQKCDLDGTRHCSSGGLHCRWQRKWPGEPRLVLASISTSLFDFTQQRDSWRR